MASKTVTRSIHKESLWVNKTYLFFFQEGTVTKSAIWLVLYAVRIFLSLPGTATLTWVSCPFVHKVTKKYFPPNNSCDSEYSSFTTRSISTCKRVDLKSKPFAYCCAYSMFNYIDWLVVCLSDFAKRCPLSFGLNTGITRVQASVDGKKPGGLLSC